MLNNNYLSYFGTLWNKYGWYTVSNKILQTHMLTSLYYLFRWGKKKQCLKNYVQNNSDRLVIKQTKNIYQNSQSVKLLSTIPLNSTPKSKFPYKVHVSHYVINNLLNKWPFFYSCFKRLMNFAGFRKQTRFPFPRPLPLFTIIRESWKINCQS